MPYRVRLTGTYLDGVAPAAVHERLALLFERNAERVAALVKAGAVIKRNADEGTARRFKTAIEAAGAGCEFETVEGPLSIDTDSLQIAEPPPAPAEHTLFEIQPSVRAHLGTLALGIAGIGAGLVAAIVLAATPWFPLALMPAGAGAIALVAVAIQIKATRYRLTSERLFARRGLIARDVQEEELYRIQDVAFRQSLWQRIFDVGDVQVVGSDATTPTIHLCGIRYPESVKETIRSAYREARRREGVRVGERIVES
jgi:membrane protein YdbS with pleckstrin-like domain